jgi:DNA-binding CsgD family transcriptional regulator
MGLPIHDAPLPTPRRDRAVLSGREVEVLRWIAAGKTSEVIADILSISVTTVDTHVIKACKKLNCVNRAHAVATAMRLGLIE